MSSTSKRLRWILALVLVSWYYAGSLTPVTAMTYYCDQICSWPNISCNEGCIDASGPFYSDCGAYGQYQCVPDGPPACYPVYGPWTYVSTIAFRNVTEWHSAASHYDCFRQELQTAVKEETQCNYSDLYACFSNEAAGSRRHNEDNCDPYYAEEGAWSCPY